ncbi:MAG: UDP-3-O-(3-hydroxymyristoyl)glucosamine N-acyltransferase [Flavobacteriaceae bacterium]|nr:UDP-3-O-(3-hydroxymyristoyl)glucosamine N-acyltransferase [Flavobacteriaceae bacterium]
MEITAEQLAAMLGGEIEGNPEVAVNNVSKLDDSKPSTLSFLANVKYVEYIYTCQSAIVLVSKDFNAEKPIAATLIRVEDPYAAFTLLLEQYAAMISKPPRGVDAQAAVASSAKVGEEVYIGTFTVVGENASIGNGCSIYPQVFLGNNVKVGKNTIIYPGVKIYHDCVVGSNCIVHAGTVIGSDGFGHAPQPDGSYKKIPQIGNVVIEDNVEVGSNCSIDRATMGSTIIRKGAKLDNLIQVAHNAEIGENTVLAAQTGLSGSTKLGSDCMIGGQVGFVGHVHIANGSKIGAQSGIMGNIEEPGKAWIGSPIYELRESFRMQAVYRNLPNLAKKVKELERELEKLKK